MNGGQCVQFPCHFQHIGTRVWETRIGALDERLGVSPQLSLMKRVAGPSNRRPLLDGPVAGGLSLFVSPEAQFVLHPSHQPVGGLV